MSIRLARTNPEIRKLSLSQLKGKWTGPVLAALVYMVISNALSYIPIPGTSINLFGDGAYGSEVQLPILSTLLGGALAIGICLYHLRLARNENPNIGTLFEGFNQFVQSIIAMVLISLITIIGMALLIVPGIIASLGLSQTFFIMADNPGINAIDAMKQSWEMTNGHKWTLLKLGLSFLPWAILTIFTLFIGMLWLMPYAYLSFANFYLQLKGHEPEIRLEDHLV